MCGYGGSKRKDDCNQAAHLQYCIFVELKFFNKLQIMLKKLYTFVGDSTYTNAPPTHRSPLRYNYLLLRASVDEKKDLPLHMAARKYAEILLHADCCLYSQHIAGKYNVIADTLSRKFDLTNDDLVSFILSYYPY
jgi:hypothetical protein